jgi:tetratricopeptide (TPR) repeat protein
LELERLNTEKGSSYQWTVGQKIEKRYQIKEIKEGGMGIVYIVQDLESLKQNRRVTLALKTFKDEFIWNERVVQRFFLEVDTWVRLKRHKNIVFALYAKQIGGKPFLFMEHVDGSNLQDWITNKRLNIPQALSFAIQICEGMTYAYDTMKIIHRDIKPKNILITKTNVTKIADFGLAKIFDESELSLKKEGEEEKRELRRIRPEGYCTPPYTSPEQWIDVKNVTTRSDIYSFGVMFYEMLTRRKPFYGATREDVKYRHQHEKPRNPRELNPSIPPQLDSLAMKCLEKDPINRYQSFGELKTELEKINDRLPGKKPLVTDVPFELPPDSELLRKGFTFLNLTKYKEAMGYFDEMLKIAPENHEAWNNKGVCLSGLGDYERAVKCFEKALELNPNYPQAWANMAAASISLGKFDEALEFCDRSIETKADWAEAWSNKGLCLERKKRGEEALRCFDVAIETDPSYWKAWINKANVLSALNKPERALECCHEATRINPREPILWKIKGDILTELGRYAESVDCYDKALQLDPKHFEAWIVKATVMGKLLKRVDEGIECLDMALKFGAPKFVVNVIRGEIFSAAGQYERALENIDAGLDSLLSGEASREAEQFCKYLSQQETIEEATSKAWNTKGEILFGLARFDEAIDAFNRSLEVASKKSNFRAIVLYNKGAALARLQRLDEAVRFFDMALEMNPSHEDARKNRERCLRAKRKETGQEDKSLEYYEQGYSYFLQQEYNKALDALDKAILANPSHSGAYALRAGIFGSLRQYDKVISDCLKARELCPDEFLAYFNLGIAYMERGDFDKSLDEFTKAIELKPDFAGSYKYRGLVYREIGEFDLALADFKTAVKLDPNDRDVRAALEEFR